MPSATLVWLFHPRFLVFIHTSLSSPLSLSLTVRQVCVCSLSPAVTPPLVFSSLHLPISCSSGIFLWANRKLWRLVIRPPVPANCIPVNQQQCFPFPNAHFHPHVSYICFSPCFGIFLLQICIQFAETVSYPCVHPFLLCVPVTPWLKLERWREMSPHYSLVVSMEWMLYKYVLTVKHS